ncbi:hypothetical protein GJV82_06755 [Cellulosimicrobium sp. BIT-GX5]|uniref:PIN domain-containing protein n=1 Tax=Cellulosimicrobium composti TaxID=2672572 RepID=A0A6N7ZGQ7_9MICO|nr:hypothetical protein [Cellulosimicrobium composti]MTG88645.1 hypothetical protein [Cellulosimicrobium composti]
MTVLVFPDTTVVRNFAILHRMDLLGLLVGERGAWCGTVARECSDQAKNEALRDMALAPDIFGAPWYPEAAEQIDIRVVRDGLASPGDGPHQHLGEAETVVLASRRAPGALFVTDDRGATLVAVQHGLKVVTTAGLIRLAVKTGNLAADVAWGYVQTLVAQDRWIPWEARSTRASFDSWVAG